MPASTLRPPRPPVICHAVLEITNCDIKIQSSRIKAALAANQELLALYWAIGGPILERQRKEGWGAKVIDRLSADLQCKFLGQQVFLRAI